MREGRTCKVACCSAVLRRAIKGVAGKESEAGKTREKEASREGRKEGSSAVQRCAYFWWHNFNSDVT